MQASDQNPFNKINIELKINREMPIVMYSNDMVTMRLAGGPETRLQGGDRRQ